MRGMSWLDWGNITSQEGPCHVELVGRSVSYLLLRTKTGGPVS